MLRTLVMPLATAALLVSTACQASNDPSSDGTDSTSDSRPAPSGGLEGHDGDTDSAAPVASSYEDTTSIIDQLNTARIPCRADGRPFTTVYSYRSQSCSYKAPDGIRDDWTVAIYTGGQDDVMSQIEYLNDINEGSYKYVFGENWTVSVGTPDLADDVAEALVGSVYGE